jgi:hypothetical protein
VTFQKTLFSPERLKRQFRESQARYIVLIGLVYLLFVSSKGTHNTLYFEEWIKGFVQGDFFSLYHVVQHQGILDTDSLTVPYPPFSLYILGIIAKILIFFGGEFSSVYLVASNLTSTVFTLLTAFLLVNWGRDRGNLSVALYLLTPAVFLISPLLGYQDTIMSFFILAALLAAEKEMYFVVGVSAALAVFSKQLAVMPMFGLGILILFTTPWRSISKALLGFAATTVATLAPFIVTGTLVAYFQAQGMASVHTMMSAQNPNLPWLISVISRIDSFGIFNEKSYSALPYQIDNQVWRQRIYLSFAALTISIIILYFVQWSRRIGRRNVSPLHIGAISISAYNLFSFGVHENHVFMLIPVLFALRHSGNIKKIYIAVSSALGLNLLATGGLGRSFNNFPLLAGENSFAYSSLGALCLAAYAWAFYELFKSNPTRFPGL